MDEFDQLVDTHGARTQHNYSARSFSAHNLSAIVREMEARGVPADETLKGAEIDQSQLDVHTVRISYSQMDRVMRNALRLAGPEAALAAGARMRITSYGMYGYALLSSATLEETKEINNRYLRVAGPLCDARLQAEGGAMVSSVNPMHWFDTASGVYRFAVEFGLAAHQAIRRDLCGPGFRFSEIAVVYPKPPHAAAYAEMFECPVRFDQPRNEFRHDIRFSEGPMPFPDARTNAMALEMCEELLRGLNSAGGAAAKVRRLLVEQLGQFKDLEGIAEVLELHPRALRRKLENEGTSFRKLLSDVRMRLAIEYLRKTMLTNEEIAYRLGYSDPTNFRRAFKRWTSKTPSDFRSDRASPAGSPLLS